MVLIDKKESRVAIVVLTATAYFTIFYDTFRDVLKAYSQNSMFVYGIAGITALGIGLFVLLFFTKREKKPVGKIHRWWDWFWYNRES